MELRPVGFIHDELVSPERGAHLLDRIHRQVVPDRVRILAYLDTGIPLFVSPGVEMDKFSDSAEPIGTSTILTDGTWGWPDYLRYYFRVYAVDLPEDFVRTIRSRNYAMPPKASIDLTSLWLRRGGARIGPAARGAYKR